MMKNIKIAKGSPVKKQKSNLRNGKTSDDANT